MKNQYAGDIGDFGKFLLLNYLSYNNNELEDLDYNLGVNWYLTEDDNTNDGKYIDYLVEDKDNLENCFPPFSNLLYEKLKLIVQNDRSVLNIIKSNILPNDTKFYNEILSASTREAWVKKSIKVLAGSNLIFFDPDNGILPSNNESNVKSMLTNELEYYYNNFEANLIVYFHHNRFEGSVLENINNIIIPVLQKIDPLIRFRILVYKKQSTRFYIVINKLHDTKLYLKLDYFVQTISSEIFYEVHLKPMNHNTNRVIKKNGEVTIQDFPAGNNTELILAKKITKQEDFNIIDATISNPIELSVDIKFTPLEYMRICYGFHPQAMEDRWIIYVKDNKVYFHRSWTGICVFILEINKAGNEYFANTAWANREQGPQGNENIIDAIKSIINNILLAKY